MSGPKSPRPKSKQTSGFDNIDKINQNVADIITEWLKQSLPPPKYAENKTPQKPETLPTKKHIEPSIIDANVSLTPADVPPPPPRPPQPIVSLPTTLDSEIISTTPTTIMPPPPPPEPTKLQTLEGEIVVPSPTESPTVVDAELVYPIIPPDVETPTTPITVLDAMLIPPSTKQILLDADVVSSTITPPIVEPTTVLEGEIVIPPTPLTPSSETLLDADVVSSTITPPIVEPTTVLEGEIVIPPTPLTPSSETLLDADVVPSMVEQSVLPTTVLEGEITTIPKIPESSPPTPTVLEGEVVSPIEEPPIVSSDTPIILEGELVESINKEKIERIINAMVEENIIQFNTNTKPTILEGTLITDDTISLEDVDVDVNVDDIDSDLEKENEIRSDVESIDKPVLPIDKKSWIRQLIDSVYSIMSKNKTPNDTTEIIIVALEEVYKPDSNTPMTENPLLSKTPEQLTNSFESIIFEESQSTKLSTDKPTTSIVDTSQDSRNIDEASKQNHLLSRLLTAFSLAFSRKKSETPLESPTQEPDNETTEIIHDVDEAVKETNEHPEGIESPPSTQNYITHLIQQMISYLVYKHNAKITDENAVGKAGEELIRELLTIIPPSKSKSQKPITPDTTLETVINDIQLNQEKIFLMYLEELELNVKTTSETPVTGGGMSNPLVYSKKYKNFNVFMYYPDIPKNVVNTINKKEAKPPIFQEVSDVITAYIGIVKDPSGIASYYYSDAKFKIPSNTETKPILSRVFSEDISGHFAKFDAIVDNQIIPKKNVDKLGLYLSKGVLSESRGVRFDKFFTILNTTLATKNAKEYAKYSSGNFQDAFRKELRKQFYADLASIINQSNNCGLSEICKYILVRRLKPYLYFKKKIDEKELEIESETKSEQEQEQEGTQQPPLTHISYIDYIGRDNSKAMDQVHLYIRPYTYRVILETADKKGFVLTETNAINNTSNFRNGKLVSHILFVSFDNNNTLEIRFLFRQLSGKKTYGTLPKPQISIDYGEMIEFDVPDRIEVPPFIPGDTESNQERTESIIQNYTRLSMDDLDEIRTMYPTPLSDSSWILKSIEEIEELYKVDVLAFKDNCKRITLDVTAFKKFIGDFIRKHLEVSVISPAPQLVVSTTSPTPEIPTTNNTSNRGIDTNNNQQESAQNIQNQNSVLDATIVNGSPTAESDTTSVVPNPQIITLEGEFV